MSRRSRNPLLAIFLLSIIAATFLPLVAPIAGVEPLLAVYRYESSTGAFDTIEVPSKGRDFGFVESEFHDYTAKSGRPSEQLFRTFPKNYWKYWRWHEYWTHPRWKLPFRRRANTSDSIGIYIWTA